MLKLHEAIKVTNQETDEISAQLTESSLEFLERNLWLQPSIVHWTIDQLLCIWTVTFNSTDSALQDVYANVIGKILVAGNLSYKPAPCYLPKNDNFVDPRHLATLLCILSKFDITESKEEELQTWLFPMLRQNCKFEDVELAFYSRRDLKYFIMWHKFIDDIYARKNSTDSLEMALKISQAIFEADKNAVVCLNTRELFIRVLRRKIHWLTDILDVCYTLAINNRLEDIAKLLEHGIFDNLWLPLLFKFLNNCPNISITSTSDSLTKSSAISTSLRFLLKHCKLHLWDDQTMTQLNSTLENYLDVIDWIIKCKKSAITDMSSRLNQQSCSITQIFRHLQTSSVLLVVKTFIVDVHDKPFVEINSLLADSIESRTVYQAYYALLSALKAILHCHCYNIEFESVGEYYEEMEKHVNTLMPLNLRLEVIENIFAMLFLRHEDFSESDNIAECAGDEAEIEQIYSSPRINSCRYQTGFVCNKYAVRETLHYLGRCLFVAENEYTRLKNKTESCQELEIIKKRLQSMYNYLTEASWRLDMLANTEFTKNQGLPDSNIRSPTNIRITNSFVKQQMPSAFYKPAESSSDETELRSDIDLSSESSLMNNITNHNGKRRRKVKSNLSDECTRRDSKQPGEFTLNYMLASKETLVLRCLWKDDYDEAHRVIEVNYIYSLINLLYGFPFFHKHPLQMALACI